MTWSTHSRRIDPISRSTYGFCHGLWGAVRTSSISSRLETGPKILTVGPVAIPQQKPWRRVPRERVADLLGRPRGRGVPRHVDMQDLSSIMGQHHEDKEHPKCERRDHEEVDRDELADVIRQERAPGLGRRGTSTHHVCPDRGFRDRDAKLQEFAVDTRGAPGRVGVAHLADEHLNGARDAWPTRVRAADSSSANRVETLVDAT